MTDPLEGFNLIDFNEESGEATIAIANLILQSESQETVLFERAKAIILKDNGFTIKSVKWVAREDQDRSNKGAE